jgi:predicted nucleic acid-binding protein
VILRSLALPLIHEDADVLADHIRPAVSQQFLEVFVDVEDDAVHVVGAYGLSFADRLHLSAVVVNLL